MEVSGQLHDPATLFSAKSSRHSSNKRNFGSAEEKNFLPPPRFEPRPVQPSALSLHILFGRAHKPIAMYCLRDVKPQQNAAEVNTLQNAKSEERNVWQDKIPAVVKVVLKMSCSTSSGEGKVVHTSVHYTPRKSYRGESVSLSLSSHTHKHTHLLTHTHSPSSLTCCRKILYPVLQVGLRKIISTHYSFSVRTSYLGKYGMDWN